MDLHTTIKNYDPTLLRLLKHGTAGNRLLSVVVYKLLCHVLGQKDLLEPDAGVEPETQVRIIRHPRHIEVSAPPDMTLKQVADHFHCALHIKYPTPDHVTAHLETSAEDEVDTVLSASRADVLSFEQAVGYGSSEEEAIANLKVLLSYKRVGLNQVAEDPALLTGNVI